MANNLFFTLDAKRKMGLEFTSHRGSQINLDPGKSTKLPLSDDEPMSKDELIHYYDFRYKRFGLDTKYLVDTQPSINGTKIEDKKEGPELKGVPIEDVGVPPINVVPVPNIPIDVEPSFDKEVEKASEASEDSVEDTGVAEETASIEKSEDERPVEDWDFKEMTAFVKENGIKTKGNSKKDYIAAIKEFKEEA